MAQDAPRITTRDRARLVLASLAILVVVAGLLVYFGSRTDHPSTAEQPGSGAPPVPEPHAPTKPSPDPTPERTR
jgi:hypothetical protein